MPRTETAIELVARLKPVIAGNHELSKDVAEALGKCVHRRTTRHYIVGGNDYDCGFTCNDCGKDTSSERLPALTTSVSDALSFLQELTRDAPSRVYIGLQENRWSDQKLAEARRWTCFLEWSDDGENIEINGTAHTAPIAMCIAALRYRA